LASALLIANLIALGLAGSPASATPVPQRPLLVIGGTFVTINFQGYHNTVTGENIPGWSDVEQWLSTKGGYTRTYEPTTATNTSVYFGEMKPQGGARPPGWTDACFLIPHPEFGYCIDWNEAVILMQRIGGSTAGLTQMKDSVAYVKTQIKQLTNNYTRKIDIVAHSQGAPIARAAIRSLAEEGDPAGTARFPVNQLVTIGGNEYGTSVVAPEFTGNTLLGTVFSWVALTSCRDQARIPICPDLFRLNSGPSNPEVPNPYSPDPDGWPWLYNTDFFPKLNRSSGVGPVPGPTKYVHLYSNRMDSGVASNSGETLELFPGGNENVTNRSIQSFCQNSNFVADHVKEFTDPAPRNLMGHYLWNEPLDSFNSCWNRNYHV
jgi:hypothetical protein